MKKRLGERRKTPERKQGRKQESKKARKQESKKARKQESKKARKQESKKARKQESKKARKQESKRSSLVHFSPLDRPHTRGGSCARPPFRKHGGAGGHKRALRAS